MRYTSLGTLYTQNKKLSERNAPQNHVKIRNIKTKERVSRNRKILNTEARTKAKEQIEEQTTWTKRIKYMDKNKLGN